MSDEAELGSDVILEPSVDLLRREILRVGMAHREIVPTHLPIHTIGDADATNISVTPRPTRATVGCHAIVFFFAVNRDAANTTQIWQLIWNILIGAHADTLFSALPPQPALVE